MNQTMDWPRVFGEHRRWLATVLRARGVEFGAIEEVLQEVQAEALRSADRLRDPAKVGPWMYRIAVTCALQYRRRLGRARRLVDRYAREAEVPSSSTEPDPLDWLLAEEQQRIVRDALTRLPSRDAELMLLKYTEDWSYRQLAEHLGMTTSAVEARLHRAREKMRRSLAQLAPEIITR